MVTQPGPPLLQPPLLEPEVLRIVPEVQIFLIFLACHLQEALKIQLVPVTLTCTSLFLQSGQKSINHSLVELHQGDIRGPRL